jgi:hypothetical protein
MRYAIGQNVLFDRLEPDADQLVGISTFATSALTFDQHENDSDHGTSRHGSPGQ